MQTVINIHGRGRGGGGGGDTMQFKRSAAAQAEAATQQFPVRLLLLAPTALQLPLSQLDANESEERKRRGNWLK